MSKFQKYISKIRGSKDGKVLIANFGYLTLLQIASYLFPLVTMPYLARVIGAEGFGKIAFASALITWFQTVTDWGFNYTATRDVARNREDAEAVSRIFSTVLWARCILMIVSFLVLSVLIVCVPVFKENAVIILVTFLLVPGHIMFPDWFFQAMERMKYITIFNIIIRTLFLVCVFAFVKAPSDYVLQPLFTSVGYLLCGLLSMYYITRKWGYKLQLVKVYDIWKMMKQSTNIFVNNIMPNFYNSFSVMLLGMVGGNVATGILDAGSKFVNLSQQFMNILSRTFFPFLSRHIEKHRFYARINILCATAISILLCGLSPWLIHTFFTPEFEGAVSVLRIMAVSLLFLSLNDVYGTNYMVLRGYEKQLRNITIISSLIGFAIAFLCIRQWGYIGAAVTIAATRGLMGILTILYIRIIERK